MAEFYQPLGDRVLIKRDKVAAQTASGLFIPDAVQQQKLFKGTVVALGDDEVIRVKVGDKVLFDEHTGTPVSQDGEDHLILQFMDVLAVIKTS